MKKTFLSTLAVLLAAVFATSAFAYETYDDEVVIDRVRVRRYRIYRDRSEDFWKERMLTRTLSLNVGMWAALAANMETPDMGSTSVKFRDPDWLFSIGAKLWFYRSRFGIGLDAVLLDHYKEVLETGSAYWTRDGNLLITSEEKEFTVAKWLVDLDVYYRLPLVPNLQLVGGVGLTYFVSTLGSLPYVDNGTAVGYNLKLGGEYFVDKDISVTGMFTWHDFHSGAIYVNGGTEETKVRLFSLGLQVNLYL